MGIIYNSIAQLGTFLSLLSIALYVSSPAHAQQREFYNGGFEANDPHGPGTATYQIYNDSDVDEWTDATGKIELWDSGFQGVSAYEGDVFAEMNANSPGTLYQDVCLVNDEDLGWSFAHRARSGGSNPQIALLEVASSTTGTLIQSLANQSTPLGAGWLVNTNTVKYTGPTGTQRIQFRTTNPGSVGNFVDDLRFNIAAFAQFSAASTSDKEASGGNLPSIIVDGRVEVATTIPFTITGGTAILGTDYTVSGSAVTIPIGLYQGASFPLPIVITDETDSEEDETIEFAISTPSSSEIVFARTVCDGAAPQTSATYTIINDDAKIEAEKTVDIYDPDGLGLFALPGNDVIYSITVTNSGELDIDDNTLFLSDTLPEQITFYNGDIDGVSGPETEPVIFINSDSGLTFDYSLNVGYSSAAAAPVTMTDCSYTPVTAGYDTGVKHICFAPKGIFLHYDPDPSFTLKFRSKID